MGVLSPLAKTPVSCFLSLLQSFNAHRVTASFPENKDCAAIEITPARVRRRVSSPIYVSHHDVCIFALSFHAFQSPPSRVSYISTEFSP